MKGSLLEKYGSAKFHETEKQEEPTDGSDDFGAFGFLRGAHDRAHMLELRFKDGNRRALGYAWLHDAEFDPSEGITLHFGGRQVKISGRNLNAEIRPNLCLFLAIIRHRVPYIQEADSHQVVVADKQAVVIESIKVQA